MNVELFGFEGCPNWALAQQRLHEAGGHLGLADLVVELREVTSQEHAEAVGFAGSPTMTIDAADLFETDGRSVGMACRVYPTPDGLAGCPTVDQLVEALTART